MTSMKNNARLTCLVLAFLAQACVKMTDSAVSTIAETGVASDAATQAGVTTPFATSVEICRVPIAATPSSAFDLYKSTPAETGDYYVRYSCIETCTDWQQCLVPAYLDDGGKLIRQGRRPSESKSAIAFVVDGMAGHLVMTPDGQKTVLIHTGVGGTAYLYADAAVELEKRLPVRTVMVRWEKGYSGGVVQPPFPGPAYWGWYSRTTAEGTDIYQLSKRVAGVIDWVHSRIAGDAAFATSGCSMGTNATFLPVLWHGLDPIIDYQLFVGGPNMWDLNAHCGRRQYASGHCDFDGVTACTTDDECNTEREGSQCRKPGSYAHIGDLFAEFANHVHNTDACSFSLSDDVAPYPPFDDSSMAFRGPADWELDHPIDLVANINLPQAADNKGGDEYWSLGEFTSIFARIQPEKNKRWHVLEGTNHCDAWFSGAAVEILVARLSAM
jgi:hypothetical protein